MRFSVQVIFTQCLEVVNGERRKEKPSRSGLAFRRMRSGVAEEHEAGTALETI
jgi:hypothetical protein